jgi:integrase
MRSPRCLTLSAQAPALAVKARQYLHGIVDYSVLQGLRDDGRPLSLQRALPKHAKGHIPAATDLKLIRKLVRAIDQYPSPVVRAALRLAMYTAMRPRVVAEARWADIDVDLQEWHVPGARMKTRHDHNSVAAYAGPRRAARDAGVLGFSHLRLSAAGNARTPPTCTATH